MRYNTNVDTYTWTFSSTPPDGGKVSNVYEANKVVTVDESRSDILVNPKDDMGWRKPSPYSCVAVEHNPISVTSHRTIRAVNWQGKNKYTVEKGSGYAGVVKLPVSRLSVYDANLERRLVNAALAKAKDQSINVGVAIAEAQKSIGLIAGTAKQVRDIVHAAKRGKWNEVWALLGHVAPRWDTATSKKIAAWKTSKSPAEKWLALQYGVLPLLGDAFGAVQAIKKGIMEEEYLIVARSSSTRSDSLIETQYCGPTGTVGYIGFARSNVETTQKVSLWYTVDLPRLQLAASLGITNPFEVAWELVKWSFVIDWFLPIGDWLAGFDADVGLTYKGGSHTFFQRCTTHANFNLRPVPPSDTSYVTQSGSGSGSAFRVVHQRTVISSPRAKITYKNPFSVGHALNAVALLRVLKR